MARPAEFDRNEVLDIAMEVFWHHGYCDTSISMLVQATGLKPGSLYGAFGSKHALFLEALDLYARRRLHWIHDILASATRPLDAIGEMLRSLRQKLGSAPRGRGGMLTKTQVTIGAHDEAIRDCICHYVDQIQQLFEQTLERARQCGDLPQSSCPRSLALLISNSIEGLWVMNSRQVAPEVYDSILLQLQRAIAPDYAWPALDAA
ncbi:TetR family transcriptional regulator [Marinobacterium nitratireducens]|uniref:TetR family transcriptional regulator n=1 Tax=Marinobacterium nitratireducens TaxID=518897 RepID=A0A918DR40_9GAMM|nr:TetR/AcrR family transcriptional regulator [Marinobacterium nitratireducens]GGO79591.1 TetR family transcriptional regulator [Marinobacterium nitratireducens]